MGHLKEKYNNSYFLGGVDSHSGRSYGMPGYIEFKENKSHVRFNEAFKFIKTFAGTLEGKTILEIGFGRGELIPFFLQENCQSYHGIDFSNAAYHIAQRHSSDSKVKLEIIDAKEIKQKKAYDIIILNHVLEHIPVYEMDIVWKRVKKALRPNGHIIIGTRVYENQNELDKSENILSTMGMICNKQTINTLIDSCEKHGFICLKENNPYFGFVLKPSHRKWKMAIQRTTPATAGRLFIGCVAENSPKYRSQALKLVQSIRWFGGRMAGANIIVCMVDEAEPKFVEELKRWGAFVQVVKRFSKVHAPSNKIRFLELPETASYDTIILMDCDTIIVSDPLNYIKKGKFQAAMAGMINVSYSNFQELFTHYHLPIPAQDFKTTIKGEPTIWYCNAGVLIFPQKNLTSFLSTWKRYIYDLYENQHFLEKFFFCEQVALTLAYFTNQIPFKELPKEMNYHLNPKIFTRGKQLDPVIIHYHRYYKKNGFIMEPRHDPWLLRRVRIFNKYLKKYKRELKNQQINDRKGDS